jgi:TrmH family RNA methyltransferase
MRMPFYSPKELRQRIRDVDGRISILFGRENWGLNNEEVRRCDMICTIPTSDQYPILNLSHAVGVVCYELSDLPLPGIALASPHDMSHLYRHINRYLDTIHHPQFKRENTMILIRRVLGRAHLTIREASTLHGLLRRSEWHIDPSLLDRNTREKECIPDGDEPEKNRKNRYHHHSGDGSVRSDGDRTGPENTKNS